MALQQPEPIWPELTAAYKVKTALLYVAVGFVLGKVIRWKI